MIGEGEALTRAQRREPFALEYRRFGIVGSAYKDDIGMFYEWFRSWREDHARMAYGKDWRCWDTEPTDEERRRAPWA